MVNSNLAYEMVDNADFSVNTNETPVKWCSVSLSDVISRGKRLEASVFDVEAKQAREIINNGKYPCVSLMGENGLIKKHIIQVDLKEYIVKKVMESNFSYLHK